MFSPQAALAFLKDRHAAFSLQHNVKFFVYPSCFPLAPSRKPQKGAEAECEEVLVSRGVARPLLGEMFPGSQLEEEQSGQ